MTTQLLVLQEHVTSFRLRTGNNRRNVHTKSKFKVMQHGTSNRRACIPTIIREKIQRKVVLTRMSDYIEVA